MLKIHLRELTHTRLFDENEQKQMREEQLSNNFA